MAGDASSVITEPPDPGKATDLAAFVGLLRRLREQAGNPGYKRTLERRTRDEHGVPRVSGSTMHRVLENRQDLSRMRDPDVFVRELVTALGADPAPWLAALERLLRPAPEPAAPAAGPGVHSTLGGSRARRRLLAAVIVVVLLAAGTVAWSALGGDGPPAVPMVGPARLSITLASDPELRLAVDRTPESPVARVRLADTGTADTRWEMVAPYRDNPDFWQLRPAGRLLACMEVLEGSYADRATVQQYGCNGEHHQHWKPEPQDNGTVRWVNAKTGQCLTVAGARPYAGMDATQRECDPTRAPLQQWRTTAVDTPTGSSAPTTTGGIVPGQVGPDPAEYPGGGKDQPCQGLEPQLDPKTTTWAETPWQIRKEATAGTRGKVSLGPEAFGAVELLRANRTTATGEETFYWAEGWVNFTPDRFTMSLQWTTLPGPGGWHTCATRFTTEHGRPATLALPRDLDHDGTGDVAFRICVTYTPELAPRTPIVNCAGRY
ncbi:RICIN domain-containing protein [Saccharothrix obliqua]|uniref:RICIN domain-containing protein n=1 Tax=Saccharothrix obliqua TaxID=2861747 RepID=UPI001C5CF4F9|nr:RICIN domain-containing protein [Saccharothrix obliqua]MBW4722302.1 RICIN domain-containing protein [Saccharothrix obliqua]